MALATLILAAGLGKRMNSDLPKVLHKVNGKPMVEYSIELSHRLHSDRTILIVGYKKELVVDATKSFDVEFVIQEPQNGTGHAVMVCDEALIGFDGDVLVLYGDVPLLKDETMSQMIEMHRATEAVGTVLTARLDNPFNYGRIIRDDKGLVTRIVEEKDATEEERKVNEINSGIYVFRKRDLFDALEKINPSSVTGELYLTDVFEVFADEGKKVCAFVADNPNEILGVNNPDQLKAVEEVLVK
jgi:UDP-N-acetylglucosamine pyrophosphorylase